MEPFTRLWNQLRSFWGGLSTLRKVLIAGAGLVVLLGLGTFTYLNQGEQVPLYYERLPPDELDEIRTALRSKGIPYTLQDSSTILVPKDRHAEAIVALAGEGVPARGGKGLESVGESSGLMTTPFIQSVNYQRALQVELERSVTQLEPVAGAKVIIARPESTPFLRDQRPPTASVVLKLKPGAALNRSQSNSIVMLVSRSVDGLKPENVTVVDSTGRLISDPHAGEQQDLPQGQIDYRRELEQYLATKAQEVLTAHLGPGRAVVKVSADVNFQKLKERQELIGTDRPAVSAERLTTTKSTLPARGGIAGAGSNVQPAGGSTGGTAGSSNEQVIQTDYVVPKTVRELENGMGAVQRLTVAALVDLTPSVVAEGETPPQPISVADAEAIIQNAVGFKTDRDSIKVTNVRLGGPLVPVPDEDEETVRIRRMASYVELARNLSLAVAVVMGLTGSLLLVLRRRQRPPAVTTVTSPTEAAEKPPEQKREELLERFVEMTRADPARTAQVFGLLVGAGGG